MRPLHGWRGGRTDDELAAALAVIFRRFLRTGRGPAAVARLAAAARGGLLAAVVADPARESVPAPPAGLTETVVGR